MMSDKEPASPPLPAACGAGEAEGVSMARRQERGCGTAKWGCRHSLQARGRMNDLKNL